MISRRAIREFAAKHSDLLPSLSNWLTITRKAAWQKFAELRADFGTADQVGRRTAFNIAGNKYRLIAASLPIPPRTETDNQRLIELLSEMDEREVLTAEEEAFAELLAIVVEDFEDRHYALPPVRPHEALKALMQDRGLRHRDVWPVVGNKGLTTEILNGRRKISSALAKRLAQHFQVPMELFI